MVPHSVALKYNLSRLRIQQFVAVVPVIIAEVQDTGGHGDDSFAAGALGCRPAGKMAAVATAGGSHRRSHDGKAIRHLPR